MSQIRFLTLCALGVSGALQGCTTTCVNGYYNTVCYTTGYYYDSRVSGIGRYRLRKTKPWRPR